MHACAIDFSKAFDRITRSKLFVKLKSKLPDKLWLLLYNYYEKSQVYIENDGKRSKIIKSNIGCKQGGCLSPRLYSIYVEEIIETISKQTECAKYYNIPIGILMFADDMILLSNSNEKLQKLVNLVENFCNKNNIKINGAKSQYIIFGRKCFRNSPAQITIATNQIERVEKIKYLGYIITENLSNKEHLFERHKRMRMALYEAKLLGINAENMSVKLRIFLYKVYCGPVLQYSWENVIFNKTDIEQEQRFQNCCIKSILGLNWRTKSSELMATIGLDSIYISIVKKNLMFLRNLHKNEFTTQLIERIKEDLNVNGRKPESLGLKSWIINLMKFVGELESLNITDIIAKLENKLNENKINMTNIMNLPIVKTMADCLKYYTAVNKHLLASIIKIDFGAIT